MIVQYFFGKRGQLGHTTICWQAGEWGGRRIFSYSETKHYFSHQSQQNMNHYNITLVLNDSYIHSCKKNDNHNYITMHQTFNLQKFAPIQGV